MMSAFAPLLKESVMDILAAAGELNSSLKEPALSRSSLRSFLGRIFH
jgi:hypothetical protein